MEFQCGRSGELNVVVSGKYSSVCDLKTDILNELGEENGAGFYLLHNGKILSEDNQVFELNLNGENAVISVVPRVLGGKGGFGSMLRAIGAQIEKTTNRDACRDLSGRRLRDINEEQRLKKWYAKQKEREEARLEAKKQKLEKLRRFAEGPALPKIDDQEYLQKREDIEESLYESVDQGFDTAKFKLDANNDASNSSTSSSGPEQGSSDASTSNSNQGKIEETAESSGSSSMALASASSSTKAAPKVEKKIMKKTMFDEDLDSDDGSDEDEVAPSSSKKAKLN